MNNRTLISIFVVCFLSTVAANSWRQRAAGQIDPDRAAAPGNNAVQRNVAVASTASLGQPPGTRFQGGASATQADDSDSNPAPYPDHSAADAPRDPAIMEVPVIVNVEDSAATGRRETIIRNLSAQQLDVRVTAINPASGSRTVVQTALPPRHRTNLTDQGLAVVGGSQIVVESPPYLPQSTTVY
jgi:hypothetical protein